MGDVRRYYNSFIMSGEMIESDGGNYVLHSDYADLLARHNALVEAVAWERECNAFKHAVWRDDSPFELHEVWKMQQAARAEVDRLLGGVQ